MIQLPDFIFDTYKHYKADTEKVLDWLARTAQACGFELEIPSIPSPRRLKGKARIDARKARKNPSAVAISVNQLTEMAKIISSRSPPIPIPQVILNMLRNAIGLRKRCAEWFAQTAKDREQHAVNVGHCHFIEVLETVLHYLEANETQYATNAVPLPANKRSLNFTAENDGLGDTQNMFSTLSIDEEDLETSMEPQLLMPPSKPIDQPTASANLKYEYTRTDEEVFFALFCFFDDLSALRGYLSDLWTRYKNGSVDLITASVTTNTAFELVQRAEKDLISTFQMLDNFEKVSGLLYGLMCYLRNEDLEYREFPDDVVNFNMLDVAEFVYLPVYSTLASFCDVIEGGYAPVYKPGYFGHYDPSCDRDQLNVRQQLQEDRIILLEILPEFFVLSKTNAMLLSDELTQGIRDMCKTKNIPLWVVYATQIYLDIHHILRADVVRGLAELKVSGAKSGASLDAYFAKSQSFRNWPPRNEEGVKHIRARIADCIDNDALGIAKRKLYGKHAPLMPTGEPYALLRWHPILCGLFQFDLYLQMQEAGIILATAWGSILYVAHLYHACRQGKYLSAESWPDMELVMKIHSPEQIFAGRIPQTPTESFNSMNLMLGASAVTYARPNANRRPGLKHSKSGPKGLTTTSPMTDVLRKRYAGKGDLSLTLETVEGLIKDEKLKLPTLEPSTETDTRSHSVLQKQWSKSHKLSVLQLLHALQYSVAAERHALRFDYFSFHLRCLDLLRAIRNELDGKFRQYFGQEYIENDTQLVFLVSYIFMVASNTQQVGEYIKTDTVESRIMSRTAGVLEAFLKDKGVLECEKLMLLAGESSA